MNSGATAGQRELIAITAKYRMSVTEATETAVPCGKSKGSVVGDLGFRERYWFATRVTRPNHSAEFQRAVMAARILRLAADVEGAEKTKANNASKKPYLDDAKAATVECRDCGHTFRMGRHKLDRRNCHCHDCGGMLEIASGLPLDELLTSTQASELCALPVGDLRAAVSSGEIVGAKIGGKWLLGQASCLQYAQGKRNDRMLQAMPGVRLYPKPTCPVCHKVFRNHNAMVLHINENHENF